MKSPAEDAAFWLPAARAGSPEALGRLLEACHGYLLMIAEQELDPSLQPKGGASDLVQETFLDAQRAFAGFGGVSDAELRAWLRRLLLNNLVSFTRLYHGTDKRRIDREVAIATGDSSCAGATEPVADTPSPSREAMAHEEAEATRRALERLPEDYRRVLLLRYEEGQSFEEIGRIMGRTANATRKLWLRAVERLRDEGVNPP